MTLKLAIILFSLSLPAFAQMPKPTLEEVSQKLNQDLPEVYDPVTKLRKTTVENNHLIFNFLIDANQKEYDWAMPKVRKQVMSTICSKSRERSIFKDHNANIVYRYENVKGQSLGEFMIRPEHCR
jgi:hypothetical protein